MQYIDHGDWVSYTPDLPSTVMQTLMGSILFCKRRSDNRDWYDLMQKELRDNTASTKLTLMGVADDWVVMNTTKDASMVFPAGCKLIEIDYSGDHEKLRQQRFDLASGEFTPMEQPAKQE